MSTLLEMLALTAGYGSPLFLFTVAVAVGDRIHDRRKVRTQPQTAPERSTREETVRNRKPVSAHRAPLGTVTAGQARSVCVIPSCEPVSRAYGVAPNREDRPTRHRQDRAA